MAQIQKKNRSKKGRKIGRDTEKCKKYRAEGRREKNKARKIAKDARAKALSHGASQGE